MGSHTPTAATDTAPAPVVDYSLRQHEVFAKEHHPDTYASGLLHPRRGYCYSCKAWVSRDGCGPYLSHASAVRREAERLRQLRYQTGLHR